MKTFQIVPYGRRKRPVTFLKAYLLECEKCVEINEVSKSGRDFLVGKVHIDRDDMGRRCFWVTEEDSFYEEFVEVLKKHRFPGRYKNMYGIALHFLLREVE